MERKAEKTTEPSGFFGPLKGWERGLLLIAACLAITALVVLLYLGWEWWVEYHHDLLTFADAIGSAGALMAGFAGSLFAFASSVLFFVALMVQLRDHRQSIREMEKTTANHAQALSVAKQEKEFNVCLQAARAAVDEYNQFRWGGSEKNVAIEQIVHGWLWSLEGQGLLRLQRNRGNPLANHHNVEDVFGGYNELMELNVRMYWTLHSINRKDVALEDRQYLNTIIFPIIRDVGRAQGNLVNCMQALDRLIAKSDEELSAQQISRVVLKYYREAFQKLYDAREYKMPQAQDQTE